MKARVFLRAQLRRRPRRSLLLLLLALAALLPVYAAPRWVAPGPSYGYLLVVDVTQSMNVRDQLQGGYAVARLAAARQAMLDVLGELPCGSRASVGLFAEQETLVLFEPLETCAHYPAMEQVIRAIDWRMAWSGNSQIEAGLRSAMQQAALRELDLVFFSDGDQAPYREQVRLDQLHAARGSTRGLVVGVGGEQERPIPRLDAEDRIVGYWQPQDAIRNGFHPNMAAVADGFEALGVDAQGYGPREHRSALRSAALQQLAQAAGLDYLRLSQPALRLAVLDPQRAAMEHAERDLRPLFGLLAGLLLLLSWLLPDAPEGVGQIRHTAGAMPTQQPRRASARRRDAIVST